MTYNGLTPGRGVVRAELLEFEVVRRNGTLYRNDKGHYLMTQPRATMVSRGIGGKMWKIPHHPWNTPQAFNSSQSELFKEGRCSYIVGPQMPLSMPERYCSELTAPHADYGYCAYHKNQLLMPGPYSARACTDLPGVAGCVPVRG